jgi:hypothetical protein
VRRIITTEKIVDVSQHGLERVVVSTIRVQRITLEEVLGRFFMLAKGLHRIRHYGLFASTMKAENLARMRELLGVATPEPDEVAADEDEAATTESTLPQPPALRTLDADYRDVRCRLPAKARA